MTAFSDPIYPIGHVVSHAGQLWRIRSCFRDVRGDIFYGLTSCDGEFTMTVRESEVVEVPDET